MTTKERLLAELKAGLVSGEIEPTKAALRLLGEWEFDAQKEADQALAAELNYRDKVAKARPIRPLNQRLV